MRHRVGEIRQELGASMDLIRVRLDQAETMFMQGQNKEGALYEEMRQIDRLIGQTRGCLMRLREAKECLALVEHLEETKRL